jgi:hypothetical protein
MLLLALGAGAAQTFLGTTPTNSYDWVYVYGSNGLQRIHRTMLNSNPVFYGTATIPLAQFDSLISTSRLYSHTVFKELSATNSLDWFQTNKSTAACGLQWTNTWVGCILRWHGIGDTSTRAVTNIVPTGYLVRSNSGALAVGPLLYTIPIGTNVEVNVKHKFEDGTNVLDFIFYEVKK